MLNGGDVVNIFETAYTIAKLLGHGKSGYSYLATTDNKKYVLKKIITSFFLIINLAINRSRIT